MVDVYCCKTDRNEFGIIEFFFDHRECLKFRLMAKILLDFIVLRL